MPAKNHQQWLAEPPLEGGEWVDSRIYSDPQIFEEELENIFKRTWVPGLSRIGAAQALRFPHHHIAREPVIVCRGPDNEVRAFLNVCPHRGMLIERRPSGSFLEGQPSGNPKRITCMFHAWQYDLKGNCVYISREKEGYQDRLCKENVGLRRLRCEVKFGGFVWVNLDDNPIVAGGMGRQAVRVPAQVARGRAARGVPLSQGDRADQLQALARYEQRVLSRLHALP